jgi:ribosomal protein S6
MKNRYECLLAVDTQGQEDSVKEIVERLESEFSKEGAAVEQVQKMEKRPFAYSALQLYSEYYVNFVF